MSSDSEFDASLIQAYEAIVRHKVYEQTGHVIEEGWYGQSGLLDSFNEQPAYREFDFRTGRLKLERWMTSGVEHRWPLDDEPSEIIWDPEFERIIQKSYRFYGVLHRDHNRAARIWYNPSSGARYRDEFWVEGKLHRDGGLPAIVEYDTNRGTDVVKQEFYIHGKKVDGPLPTLQV